MKKRQHKNCRLMKGVSDIIYLAFVSILSISGAYYIYNDINANITYNITAEVSSKTSNLVKPKTTKEIVKDSIVSKEKSKHSLSSTTEAKTLTEIKTTVDDKKIAIDATAKKIEKKPNDKVATLENSMITSKTSSPPVLKDKVTTNSPKKQQQEKSITETVPPVIAIEVTDSANKTELATTDNSIKTIQEPDQSESSNTSELAEESNKMHTQGHMPQAMHRNMRNMHPQYYNNHPMYQAQRYMPPAFMPPPYYQGNGNYPYMNQPMNKSMNRQPYSQQGQRRMYNNQNRPYSEQYQYTPWNPGHFY